MLLGAVLVEQGDLAAAALARALLPDEAARPRAKRLAEAAVAGFAQLGKFREPQRQAVNGWLADPTKPIAIAMVP